MLSKDKANRDGRPSFSKAKPEVIRRILALRKEGLSYRKIAKVTGVSPTTAYNYITQQAEEKASNNNVN
ncbi:MAG: helix-turn-helix domain-containing protein [Oscillospiraceae bacterium]|nr:helix-turn-helix domain-containing protein [Oscillospiraceae bacterium]